MWSVLLDMYVNSRLAGGSSLELLGHLAGCIGARISTPN